MTQAAPATWPYNHATVEDVERRHGRRPRPMPADFVEYARAHNVAETRAHYGIAYDTFRKWTQAVGLTEFVRERSKMLAATRVPPRAVPDDFADHAATESSAALRRRYGTVDQTIARWRQETGIPAPRPQRPASVLPVPKAAKSHRRMTLGHWRGPVPIAVDSSTTAQAQRFLQRFGPCFRAATLDPKRSGYVVDGKPMSDSEMLALAEKRGWERF